jgi:superfamily II DNA/RNA helicase
MSPISTPSFASLGVPAPVVAALVSLGAREPFPIQTLTLADSLAGRDLLGRGKTGSGKTIAFAIPLVSVLSAAKRRPKPNTPRGLVLVPTRELAEQVAATIRPLASALRLHTTVVYGGVGFGHQIDALRRGVDIVVACPGRLEDLVQQGHCRLDSVEVTVLDEADHMTDMGFLPAVRRLLDATPAGGQRMLFSATLDNDVASIVDRYLHDPVRHSLDTTDAPAPPIDHHVLTVALADKLGVVARLAAGSDRVLLFTRTKHGAKKLVRQLDQQGIGAVELHGNLSQSARQRNLAAFTDGSVTVLVATDIAARGIHVDDVTLVVHVDPPAEHKAFVHRSGRTARAGAEGSVVTIMTPEQARDVKSMLRAAGVRPTFTADVTATHQIVHDLAGDVMVRAPRRKHQPALRPEASAARVVRAQPASPAPNPTPGNGRPRQQGKNRRRSHGAGRSTAPASAGARPQGSRRRPSSGRTARTR